MLYWTAYSGHAVNIYTHVTKKDDVLTCDGTIYTLDIETTSYFIDTNGKMHPSTEYEEFKHATDETGKEVDKVKTVGCCMYIWMIGVNDAVYYGRTWDELKQFLEKIAENNNGIRSTMWVFNLPFEFSYICSIFDFSDVFARKKRAPMKSYVEKYDMEFRCAYALSQSSLAALPKTYDLPIVKKVGDLDYTLIRHSKTPLTDAELGYCEGDCLVLYEYIKSELAEYKTLHNIPMTATGKVRRKLKEAVEGDREYYSWMYNASDDKPGVFNALLDTYAGGYSHANCLYAGEIVSGVLSFDFTSSYPAVMLSEKFPCKAFTRISRPERVNINNLVPDVAYMLRIRFHGLECQTLNTFISHSKCLKFTGIEPDNGRIVSAKMIEIWLNECDIEYVSKSYTWEKIEILEAYTAPKDYLPKKFIEFILDMYIKKTQWKGIPEKITVYNRTKADFNSLYGMCVTNDISDMVIYNGKEWYTEPVNAVKKLRKKKNEGFLAFPIGVWVSAYARRNLLMCVIQEDENCLYCDTDSMKLKPGFDAGTISRYNESIIRKLFNMCEKYGIDKKRLSPVDKDGAEHMIGVWDNEWNDCPRTFKTLGSKKYVTVDESGKLTLTLAGVDKKRGAGCLKDINDFADGKLFPWYQTGALTHFYCDNMDPVEMCDYLGNRYTVTEKSGISLMPCNYVLGQSSVQPDCPHGGWRHIKETQ